MSETFHGKQDECLRQRLRPEVGAWKKIIEAILRYIPSAIVLGKKQVLILRHDFVRNKKTFRIKDLLRVSVIIPFDNTTFR
jgi:hypothetical protein